MTRDRAVGSALPERGESVLARSAADGPPPPPPDQFDARAVGRLADVARDTLNAVAFPTFVADLINGTFNAIVNTSIRQMEASANLLSNVAKAVDQSLGWRWVRVRHARSSSRGSPSSGAASSSIS